MTGFRRGEPRVRPGPPRANTRFAPTSCRQAPHDQPALTPRDPVSVVIVSWNVLPLLRDCLTSVIPQLEAGDEILVVDNASSDPTPEALPYEFPEVQLIQAGANLGFPAGVNLGLSRSRGRFCLVLNPDTALEPGALEGLRLLMERDPSIGLAAPRLRFPDGAPQSSRRRFPSRLTLFTESTPVQGLPGMGRVLNRFYLADRSDAHVQEVDWVSGACFLVRREALEEVGALDPTYFMYSEETDLCRRLHDLGWATVYEPAAEVIHHHAQSSDQVPAARLVRFNRSKVYYARKHLGRVTAGLLRRYLPATFVWEMAVEGAKLMVRHKPELRRRRLDMYREALRTGLGATD